MLPSLEGRRRSDSGRRNRGQWTNSQKRWLGTFPTFHVGVRKKSCHKKRGKTTAGEWSDDRSEVRWRHEMVRPSETIRHDKNKPLQASPSQQWRLNVSFELHEFTAVMQPLGWPNQWKSRFPFSTSNQHLRKSLTLLFFYNFFLPPPHGTHLSAFTLWCRHWVAGHATPESIPRPPSPCLCLTGHRPKANSRIVDGVMEWKMNSSASGKLNAAIFFLFPLLVSRH